MEQIPLDNEIILPQGTAIIYSDALPHNYIPDPVVAAKRVESYNSVSYLREHIFDPKIAFVRIEFEGLGLVQTIPASHPYNEGSLLIVGTKSDLFHASLNPEQVYDTLLTTDLPFELQEEYYRQVFTALIAFQSEASKRITSSSSPQAIALENATRQVSKFRKRSSRSVGVPHTQVLSVWDSIDKSSPYQPWFRLLVERHLLSDTSLMDQALNLLIENMMKLYQAEDDRILFNLRLRGYQPYGYTFDFPEIDENTILDNTKIFAVFSVIHAKAYYSVIRYYFSKHDHRRKQEKGQRGNRLSFRHAVEDIAVTQPAYRSYIYFMNGRLHVTFSPEVFSPAGVLQAAGVKIERRQRQI